MQKVKRLVAIGKIIEGGEISSQEVLMKKLLDEGIACTQATLSRDLRRLGVLRVPASRGGYRYVLQGKEGNATVQAPEISMISVIRSLIDANSMVLIKTKPGYANSIGVTIDNASRYEIAGTIAGDDTLLVIPRDKISLQDIHECLEMILPGMHKQAKRE
ncbi:MAG: ArgR family transcriptional regulator [Bacteroidales bacterium]